MESFHALVEKTGPHEVDGGPSSLNLPPDVRLGAGYMVADHQVPPLSLGMEAKTRRASRGDASLSTRSDAFECTDGLDLGVVGCRRLREGGSPTANNLLGSLARPSKETPGKRAAT
jgi:hypothetical protein